MLIFEKMKSLICCIILLITCGGSLLAQDMDLQLAKQFAANGEEQKALGLYQKLYDNDPDEYFSVYFNSLLQFKKFDHAERIAKKMIHRHPDDRQYAVMLGAAYSQQGETDKANALYDDLLKNLSPDQGQIAMLAAQFYQNSNLDYAIKVFLRGRKLLRSDALFTYELINLYRFKRDKIGLVNEYLNFLPSNPTFLSQAENTMANLFDGPADYNILKSALLKKIQQEPQQAIYPQLLTWQYLQQKDFGQALNQAIALSRRENDNGAGVYDLCGTLALNDDYDDAIRGYQYLVSKGKDEPYYISSKIELIDTKDKQITAGRYSNKDLLSLQKDYKDLLAELGQNTGTVFAMQKLADLEAFKLHDLNDAQTLLEAAIAVPGIRPDDLAQCKLKLGDVLLLNGKPWSATLLYSQVAKNNPGTSLAQDATYRNAKLAYYTGDFAWAKGQLDVLKAATSELIANDALNLSLQISENLAADSSGAALKMFARADLLIFAEQPEKAMYTLDSIDVKYPGNSLAADILMAKAKLYLEQKKYEQAVTELKKVASRYSAGIWADDAVFMLGDIYENHLDDKAQAKIYYQKIITDYAGSLWINEARKRFRLLRGDKNIDS